MSAKRSDQLVDGELWLPGGATTRKMIILSFLDDLVPERSKLTEPSFCNINM
jgi:hypothetical protein